MLIAREMGADVPGGHAELLGSLAFLLTFMGIFFFMGDMGNNLAFENVLAKGYKFKDCFRVFQIVKIKLTVQMAIIGGLLIAVYVFLLAPEAHTAIHPVSMIIILGYFIAANLAQIWVVGLTLRERPMLAKSYDLIEGLVKFAMVAGIILLALTHGDQNAIFMLSLIYLIAGTMGMMIIRNNARYFKKGENDDEINPTPQVSETPTTSPTIEDLITPTASQTPTPEPEYNAKMRYASTFLDFYEDGELLWSANLPALHRQ